MAAFTDKQEAGQHESSSNLSIQARKTAAFTDEQEAGQHEFPHLVDVLGNMPLLRRYIPLYLFFELDGQTSLTDIETELRQAHGKLVEAFPYLAGKVVLDGVGPGCSGTSRVVTDPSIQSLIIRDHRQSKDVASFSEFRDAGYPFDMLSPETLSPPIVLAISKDKSYDGTGPVLVIQANILVGGICLSFSGHHGMMDMTGLGMIIAFFAKACRGESLSAEEIASGNQSRTSAIPLLGAEYEVGDELKNWSPGPTDPTAMPPVSARWTYWNFTPESLSRLKAEAGKQSVAPYISTDDAVAALMWQRVSKAKSARLGTGIEYTFVRPCSMRKYLGLEGYTGHMLDALYEDVVDVWSRPVGEIAGRLRNMLLQNEAIVLRIRALATMLSRMDDKSKLVAGLHLDRDRDMMISSYANTKCCERSFGPLLGRPEVARRSRMPPVPLLGYIMPKARNGDMAFGICLEEDDLNELRKDEVLSSYASYIG